MRSLSKRLCLQIYRASDCDTTIQSRSPHPFQSADFYFSMYFLCNFFTEGAPRPLFFIVAKEDAKGIQRKRYEDGRRASRVKELEKEVVCPKSDEKEGIRRFFFSDEKRRSETKCRKEKIFCFSCSKIPIFSVLFYKERKHKS